MGRKMRGEGRGVKDALEKEEKGNCNVLFVVTRVHILKDINLQNFFSECVLVAQLCCKAKNSF